MASNIERITSADVRQVFAPYPLATKSNGLVFLSGIRAGMTASNPRGFEALPSEGQAKRQGYSLADTLEGVVTAESWNAHENLERVLRVAGTMGDQLLRQHIWQRDKRFFPCYERVRMHWQAAPAPSSGLGVARISGRADGWIGIDGIAVCPGENGLFGARQVMSGVDSKQLPSASHYSQAVRSGPLLFTAGHIAIKTAEPGKPLVNSFDDVPPEGRSLATGRSHPDSRDGPIAAQTWYIYNELRRTIEQHGLAMRDVVHATVFLGDLRDFGTFHRVHRHFFPEEGPSLCVAGFDEVGHRGCRIEIELTALDGKAALTTARTPWTGAAPFAAPAVMRAGPLLYCSGMLGIGADGLLVHSADALPAIARGLVRELEAIERVRGLAAQCWAALSQLKASLASAGSSLAHLAKTSVYVRDQQDFAVYERVRTEFMRDSELPAVEVIVVQGPGPVSHAHVQIESIAIV
ncbi:MAG: Rid family hydrolase [Burkholderiales bacterium]